MLYHYNIGSNIVYHGYATYAKCWGRLLVLSYYSTPWVHTCKTLSTLTNISPFDRHAFAPVLAFGRVAHVHLVLTIVAREASRALAAQAAHGVDGPEQNRVRGHEGRRAVEVEGGDASHVVLAGFAQADVVVERHHSLHRIICQHRSVQVYLEKEGEQFEIVIDIIRVLCNSLL